VSSKSTFTRDRYLRVHWDDDPDHEFHGAVIRMKRLSIDDLQEMSTMDIPEGNDEVTAAQLTMIVERLADGLMSWNLVDEEGNERAPSPSELRADAALCMALLDKWMHIAGSVSGPLDGRSINGSQSRAASALMDLPSESP